MEDSQVLYEAGAPIDRVYFPQSAVISIVQLMQEGSAAEIGMVGCEGVSGVESILGGGPATGRHICQVPGTALSLSAGALRRGVKERDDLLRSLLGYVGGYAAMLAQLIACNRLHRVEQRCARWLLMTVDRSGRLEFPMTQERLSMMLGAQRPTVTTVMTSLRDAGCLENTRGRVKIKDRKCLGSFACECYQLCRSYFGFED
ncbi:MAG: Crp/Fnr family transcriptional regulator [Candidatus Eremiobacteraeota bacterium]|nr:Crp/Fnr family transcriptional regulator [Candidatus Eremiobacteraeota bacterium]